VPQEQSISNAHTDTHRHWDSFSLLSCRNRQFGKKGARQGRTKRRKRGPFGRPRSRERSPFVAHLRLSPF